MQSLRVVRGALIRPATSTILRTPIASRTFSATRLARSAGEHESEYDPPGGWLWGVKPEEEYEKEGWEGLMFWGMGGSVALAVVAYAFKPDTSIQTWALEEARRRLEAEGILPDPDTNNKGFVAAANRR